MKLGEYICKHFYSCIEITSGENTLYNGMGYELWNCLRWQVLNKDLSEISNRTIIINNRTINVIDIKE